jgi:formylglycine-generating enzyme required for sulfatase activity
MDKYEVSITLWDSVYQWGMSNGYVFATGSGKAPHHPVNSVTWNECVKWCNARSEKEGLTPCFYTDGLSTIYRTGDVALSNEWVNWSANGYRLPTEAEWEKAARGGTPGHRFSWSDVDTISHSQANYWSSDFDAYDVSPTRGYHPTYDDGVDPYTSPVGVFLANGYGLYDMTGNVDEWCWDWFEESWYSNAGATLPDTHGPSAGTYRVIHGGDWDAPAGLCRTSVRRSLIPSDTFSLIGFRCARRQ